MLSEPLLVVSKLVDAFETLGIRYLIGGSFASSLYGVPRATQDVDLVAEVKVFHAEAMAQLLAGEFYVDVDLIRDAARKRSSFNVIHLGTMFKADVFIMQEDVWSLEEMMRARPEPVEGPQGLTTLRFASPEDTLLHKLVWYRLGHEISDRQWNDILGVLMIQAERLDDEYLERWAAQLGVADLLARAREQR